MARDEPKLLVAELLQTVARLVTSALSAPVWRRFAEFEQSVRILADKARAGEEVKLEVTYPPADIDVNALAKAIAFHAQMRDSVDSDRVVGMTIHVKKDDILVFEGGIEPVEVNRLHRIIGNATEAAERVKAYVDQQHKGVRDAAEIKDRVSRSAATRYASVLHASFESLLDLIGGKDFERRTPDWRQADEEITGAARQRAAEDNQEVSSNE